MCQIRPFKHCNSSFKELPKGVCEEDPDRDGGPEAGLRAEGKRGSSEDAGGQTPNRATAAKLSGKHQVLHLGFNLVPLHQRAPTFQGKVTISFSL